MSPSTQRADLPSHPPEETAATATAQGDPGESHFDPVQWQESASEREFHGAGGRAVLGAALAILSLLWLGFTAWSAGRALADQPIS